MIRLDTLDDPRLADYRSLKNTNLTRWSNRFIAEGRFVVERLLVSDLQIHSVLVAENQYHSIAPQIPEDVQTLVLPKALMTQLVGFRFHQGVLACAERPASPRWDDLLANAAERATWVACSRVVDPVNLATIMRLCTAFGVTALLLESGCADPYSRRAVRVSMGNVFRLPVLDSANLQHDLAELRSTHGFSLIATVLRDDAESLDRVQPAARNILVFGNEGEGLSPEWIDLCDRQITIPMRGGTDSLNVAVAAGIFLYQFDPHREHHSNFT